MTVAVERKYALIRIKTGDYILPSNDRQTIWRISKYVDGPSQGLDDLPRDKEFWGVWRWTGRVGENDTIDVEDWDRWDLWSGLHDTRAQAVTAAMEDGFRA